MSSKFKDTMGKFIHRGTLKESLRWLCIVSGFFLIFASIWLFVGNGYRIIDGAGEVTLLVGDRIWVDKLSKNIGHSPERGNYVIVRDPAFSYAENALVSWWQRNVGIGISWLGLRAGPNLFPMRVIGTPGDVVSGKVEGENSLIIINNKVLDEPYVNKYPLLALKRITGFINYDTVFRIPIPKFLQIKQTVDFYSYDPIFDIYHQPFYEICSRELYYKPGTYQRYFRFHDEPMKDLEGNNLNVFGPINIPEGRYFVMGDNRHNSLDSRMFGLISKDSIVGYVCCILYSIDSREPFWLLTWFKHPLQFWTKFVRWGRTLKNVA